MKTNKIRHKLTNLAALSAMIFGLTLLSMTDAQAQFRGNRQILHVERGNNNNVNRIGRAQGYSDGLREGSNAARGRKRKSPYDEGKFKKATNGYKSRFGNREAYKQSYRQGFLRGYDEAYRRNNRVIRVNRRSW
jgi:flagellar biosynthesis/type III secretory pathway protein FliH